MIDDIETPLGAIRLGDGDRPAQLDDRRVGDAGKLAVEGCDLGPIPRLDGMQTRDRRLHDVRTTAAQRQRSVQHDAAVGDLRLIPERAVLVGEHDDLVVAEAGVPPCVEQQHHGQQSVHLRLVGHELDERPAEQERLRREFAPAAVALVEDQINDREDREEPIGQQVLGRYPERDPRGLDLALRSHQSLRHRGLGHQEGVGDLNGRQATERPKHQRDLSVDSERRMTAREDELESLVGERRGTHPVLSLLRHLEHPGFRRQRAIPTDAIDGSVASGRHQPGARVGGDPIARPPLRGDREGLLRGFLGEFEIAEEADQRREHTSPLVAEDLFEDRYHSTIGRTSIAPPRRAAGIRAASSIAASRSSASNSRYPPTASLISTNGPSVVSVLPSCTRTVVAVSGAPSPRPGVTPGVWLMAW